MYETIPANKLEVIADIQFRSALNLKKTGHYSDAFNMFEDVAQKYHSLAKKTESTGDMLDYLSAERECYRNMLVDAWGNLGKWSKIMLRIKDITDEIEDITNRWA